MYFTVLQPIKLEAICNFQTGEKMMKMYKGIMAAMLAGLMFTGLTACEKE